MAAAAYRAGEKLQSEYYGTTADYTRKSGVVHKEIFLPANAPEKYRDRTTLWNAVEYAEKNPRAQLAYSFDIALQNELSMEENIALARAFVQEQLVSRGMIADLAVHMPEGVGGDANPHFHVLTTMRPLNPDGSFGAKQRWEYKLDEHGNRLRDEHGNYIFNAVHTTDWHTPKTLEAWRKTWCDMVNAALEKKRLPDRVDHRSYERQGSDQLPTVHEGPAVRAMEARGIRTEVGGLNRWIRRANDMLRGLKERIAQLTAWIDEYWSDAPELVELLQQYFDQRYANAYSHKGKTASFKEHTEMILFLEQHDLLTMSKFRAKLDEVETAVDGIKARMDALTAKEKQLKELIRYGEMYAKSKPVYQALTGIRWKGKREKFAADHDSDIRRYHLSKRKLKELLGEEPVTVKVWQDKLARIQQERSNLYLEYAPQQDFLMQLWRVKNRLDRASKQLNQPEKTITREESMQNPYEQTEEP